MTIGALEACARWNEDKAAKFSRQLRHEKNHDSLVELRRNINRHMHNAYDVRQLQRSLA